MSDSACQHEWITCGDGYICPRCGTRSATRPGPAPPAADDFAAIGRRLKEIEAEHNSGSG